MITSFFKPKKKDSAGARNKSPSKKIKKEEPEKENNSTVENVKHEEKTMLKAKKIENSKFPIGKTFVKKVCSNNEIQFLSHYSKLKYHS